MSPVKLNTFRSSVTKGRSASWTLTVGALVFAGCVHGSKTEVELALPVQTEGQAVVLSTQGQADVRGPKSDGNPDGAWKSMFDGKTLDGWKMTDFAGPGEVRVEKGDLVMEAGVMLTGVSWTNSLPKTNYEVSLEAMKKDGTDFFCGLTFPVGDSHCSFIVGGWGGGIIGLSSIDSMDASENETTKYMNFEKNKWYQIRVRVTPTAIEAWIDDEQMVDQSIVDRNVGMRPGEIELSEPFGIAAYQTTSALRNIRIRRFE